MKRALVVGACACALLVIAVGALLFARLDASGDARAREFGVAAATIPNATEIAADDEAALEAGGSADAARVRAEASAIDAVEPRPASPAPRRRGRVLDLDGVPVAGVPLATEEHPTFRLATSGPDGWFELPADPPEFVVTDGRWFTLRDTEPMTIDGDVVVLVVVARALRVGGRVVDPAGDAVEGATVSLDVPWSTYAGFPIPLDRGRATRGRSTTSDASGAFELVIPSAPRARLAGTKEGRGSASIAAPADERSDLVLVLAEQAETDDRRIRGVVVHADGTPGLGATVRYGSLATQVDDDGRFELALGHGDRGSLPLVAVKRGHQSAFVADFSAVVELASGPLPEQRLVLGPPPLAIEGLVVDHEGRPKKGWIVQPLDPLILYEGRIPPESAESVARGGALRAVTDERGAFVLDGLDERSYRLQAHSKEDLARIESGPIAAGARNARLVVPADAYFARVDGVVESADGTPIAGVEVRAALITFRTESGFMTEHGDATTTGADGRFTLTNVPAKRARIDADGDAILPANYDLETHVDGRLVRIVAARRCHVRVEGVTSESKVRHVEVHDARGTALTLMQFQSGGWMSSSQVSIEGGGSPLFAVSETARTIVFVDEDGARTPRPLALAHGSITSVRW